MISIAHPHFRDELFEQAKELDFIDIARQLKESIHGVYLYYSIIFGVKVSFNHFY